MPIEDFLVDFYSKNTDQKIDQVKIDSIVSHYNGDNVSMINDLYEKYDTGNINDDKVLEIKEYYSIDLPKQGEVVEETTIQEPEVVEDDIVVGEEVESETEVEEITENDWVSTEEDFIKKNKEKLARLYPDFEFSESTFDWNGVTVKNKITGEQESFDLDPESKFAAGFSDFNEFKDFVGKKLETDPVKLEVFNKTGLTVDFDDYGDTRTNNTYNQVEILVQEGKPAPFLPEQLGVTYGEETRSPSNDEMLTLVNSIEGVAIDFATNLQKVFPSISSKNKALSIDFDQLKDEEKEKFVDKVYDEVKKQTGLNITKDSFYSIYGDDISSRMQSIINSRSADIAKPRIYEASVKGLGRTEASKEYQNRTYNNLEKNLTKEQLYLRDLNDEVEKIDDQIQEYELQKGRSSQVNDSILELKEKRQDKIDKIIKLGGGVWDSTGNWINTLNVNKETKENLKKIEKNAANMGAALNAFASEGTDLEKLSAKDLSRNLLSDKILETEYLDSVGAKDSISLDLPREMSYVNDVTKVVNLLNAKGGDYSIIMDDGFVVVDNSKEYVKATAFNKGNRVTSVDLTYNDLYNLGVRSEEAGGYKGYFDDVLAKKEGGDILNYRIWEEEKLENEAEIRGLYRLVELGENPALVKKPTDAYSKGKYRDGIPLNGVASDIFGFGETALFQALPESVLAQWGGYNKEEIQEKLGQSPRNLLDQIEQTVSIINNSESVRSGKAEPIKLTEAQEENLEMGLSEMTATATGGFVPTLLEFAAFELATGGTGTGAAIAKLPKLGRFLAGAIKEEVKMQSTTADFGLGTGALFFGLGKVFQPIKFFKKHRVGLNQIMDKYVKAGPAGAMTMEGSEIVHAIVDDMLDNGDFRTAMDQLYGDTDETTKRIISNTMMFKLTGFQHLKGRDFLSNHGLGRTMNKLNNRSRDLAKQSQRLLIENGINTIPDARLTPDGQRIPTTSGDKNFKIQEQLSKLSKENTPEGRKASELLNKLSRVSETMLTIDQMLSIRTQHQALNPFMTNPSTGEKIVNKETGEFELNPRFENNFNTQITKPIFKALSESAPKGKNGESTFVNPEVLFLNAKDAKLQMQEGNTAEFLPEQNKILIDLSKYTPGKPLHELSHVIFNAYFKKNPQAKINFTNKMREMFKGVDFGTFKDTELRKAIEENYKDKDVQGEEYIAFLTEFLSDPKVYYQNKYTSGTFVNGIKSEIRLIKKRYGMGDFAPPKTAEDLVKTLSDLGREFQKGYVSNVSASQFAALGKINLSDVEYFPANTDAKAKRAEVMASKDLTKEAVVSKSNKEIADANLNIEKEIKDKAKLPVGNRVRDIKDPVLRQEIKDKLEKNNRGAVNAAANKAANNPKILALEKSKRVSENEFKSGFNEQLANLIDTYKPVIEKNGKIKEVPFGAYMQENLKRRFNQILIQAKKGEFKGQSKRLGQDRAEGEKEFDIKSEEATPEEALIASEEIKAKVTPKSKVTRDFPEIFTEDLKNEIDKGLLEIFEGELPGVETKEFKSFITEASRGKLTNKIKKALGAGKNYEFSIKKMAEKMKETLDPRFFVRLESQTKPENRIFTKPPRRLTKQAEIDAAMLNDKVYVENTAQGVNIYEFKDFTPKQLSDYILAPTTSPTTGAKSGLRGTRKTAFAEGLVDRLTRDATPQNLKRIGKETGEIAEISKKMQVDPSTIMASKSGVVDFIKRTGLKDYTLEKLERDLKLTAEGKNIKVPEEVKNLLIDFKRRAMVDASESNPTFKSESKLFKGTKFKNQDIAFKDIFNGETGKGTWGQTKKNGKKIYEEYDLPRIEEQIEQAIQFAKVFPKAFLKGENLTQTFFMGTRSTAKQVRTLLDGTSKTPKYVKGTVDPKTGIGVEIGTVASLKNQRVRLEKALGSGKTSKFFNNLITDYKPEGVQKSSLKKAMEKASTDAERIDILQKAINKGDNKIKSDLYYAIESAKQEWLYSSKDKNEFIQRAKFIYQGASSNTNLILGSSRQFVPIEAVYFKPGEKFSFEKLKLEHLKSSLKQSMDAARAVVEGRFIEQGRDIMSDYKGIISEKKYLDVIDKIGGVTNTSGLARMTADLNNLKNYRTVESGFKETLYDKIIKETAKEINEKSSELENSFISDLVAKYIAEPTPSNEIILKSKIKDKANLRKLKTQNKSVVEEASMASKDLSQSEMLNELNKRDKAFRLANERNKTIKKARVFDFDDTVARTNSKVFAERNGIRKILTAEQFATKGKELVDAGWVMDFTDFNRVVEGKKGPLFDLMKKMKESAGDRDMFILTARAKESAPAIKEFLDAMGINIPLENITGLGNSTGKAKADWLVGKASEGYNDFYFADDAPQNVKAVKEGMSRLDVKSKTQLVKASKDLKIDSERDKKKLSWKTDEAGNIKTTFKIAGKEYNFNLDSRDSKGTFDVEFNLGGRIDVTGTGNAVKVIRTVYDGLLDAVSQNPKIKKLEFSSLKSETSRVKLYTTLMDKVAKKLGWETDIWETKDFIGDNSSYDFEIAKPRKKQVGSVEKVLDVVDVKSETQKTLASKDLSGDFNKIIEESTGIGAEKVFSDVKAEIRGNKARRQKFFIPPSAEDFTGLLYRTLGKGKKGEAHMKFYQDALLDPYARAMENLSTDRVNLMSDFKALKKQLDVPKDLRKTTESGFTNEQAVRSYLWGKEGKEIPGLSKADMKELSDLVENNPKLKAFADQIMSITKGDGYSTPTKNWATGTITTDLIDVLNTTKRAKYLETWNQNKDIIFSKDNLNKLEAAYGTKYKESMENILTRMKSGRNRIEGGNVLSNKVLDYINNSTGAIMFFNTRSAVLQTISAANFINWGFNNPLRAGKAFANQPQYWKDFVKLINSDYLKDRRNGLKLNISESEIADAAKTSTNKAKAGLNYILEKGYLPTKFADSFAIASGGATFYRNRINDLIKNEGLTKSEAEIRAMKEFREVSEISQQSSDPSKISSQQASTLGRVVLQFANTPMQYARIQKRAVQDIVNGRGDLKTNISKIAYYGFLQNMLFNSLQQGLFALGFGDDEIDEKEEQKVIKMANGMVDSSLRGLGFAGVTVQVLKNLGIDLYDRSKRDRPEYSDSYIKLLDFSPAIKSKLSKFRGAAYPFDSKKRRAEVFEKGFSLDNPAYESMAKVVTATTNLPLDRLYSKVNNLSAAMDDETETWQSIAMVLGWPEWQIKGRQNYVEAPKTEEEKIKIKEQKIKIKEEKSKTRLKEAKGSTDYETLKKLNKSEQLRILKNLGVGGYNLKKYKKLKEAELIEEIIKRNKK